MFKRLHPLFNADGDIGAESGVEIVPAAEEQIVDVSSETGDEIEVAAEPGKTNNFEKAFAKRLAAKEAEWESKKQEEFQKLQDQYKDHDHYKKAAEYLQKTTGINDILTLKEEIELTELQERAEETGITPEMQRRLEVLEAKASKVDQMEAQQQQEQEWKQFEDTLKNFCEGKEIDGKAVDHTELWKYMHENEVTRPEVAYKAMKADVLEQKLSTAKEDTINSYLASKQAPRAEGNNGAPGSQRVDTRTMSWKEIEKHAAARLEAAKQPQ